MAEKITLAHGSGGRASHELIEKLFVAGFGSKPLAALEDSVVLAAGSEKIAFSTDSFVVDPIFFPGGDIGSLAIHGTVNDLAMRGATPLYISVGLIIEEGFAFQDLATIVRSLKAGADKAGIQIVNNAEGTVGQAISRFSTESQAKTPEQPYRENTPTQLMQSTGMFGGGGRGLGGGRRAGGRGGCRGGGQGRGICRR